MKPWAFSTQLIEYGFQHRILYPAKVSIMSEDRMSIFTHVMYHIFIFHEAFPWWMYLDKMKKRYGRISDPRNMASNIRA